MIAKYLSRSLWLDHAKTDEDKNLFGEGVLNNDHKVYSDKLVESIFLTRYLQAKIDVLSLWKMLPLLFIMVQIEDC